MQLGLALAALGVTTSLVAQHIYALNPYAFLSRDYNKQHYIHITNTLQVS
jgi:photosystem I P700 chlorophyll a apoprotein A2